MKTRKRLAILFIISIALVLAACGGSSTPQPTLVPTAEPVAEPTQEPTEEPAPEPTEEPSELVAEAELANLSALVAHPWQWVSFTNPAEAFEVEMPISYLAQFNEDGTVNIAADCNNAAGGYTADGSSLTIEIGPMTLAACPPESRSDQFIQLLGGAAIYFFEGGNLFIDLMADGGTMAFAPASEEALADDGEGALAGSLPEDLVAQLDIFLQTLVYSEGDDPVTTAPGVVLLVDMPEGRYLNAAGVASLEEGTPIQVDDRLEIGSNSKSFTIALLMQLQEEGILSLDDSLSQWLPEWAEKIPYGNEMTLRQLAQHTSGLWDYGDPIIGQAATNPVHLEDYDSPEQLVQYAIDNGTPDFEPGEEGQWNYSNTGYILLGMIIEAASGEKLGDLYQSRIFDPLDLESAVLIEGVPEPQEIIDGYYWADDGHRLNTTKWNVSQGWAAGGIAMNAEDLLTYGKALAAGELFQDPDSLAQMLTFDPAGMNGSLPYGLGLIDFSPVAPGSWGHEGQTAGFQSLWFTNPDSEITVVGLSNSATFSAFSFLNVASMLADMEQE